jgi:hypothetical protein
LKKVLTKNDKNVNIDKDQTTDKKYWKYHIRISIKSDNQKEEKRQITSFLFCPKKEVKKY